MSQAGGLAASKLGELLMQMAAQHRQGRMASAAQATDNARYADSINFRNSQAEAENLFRANQLQASSDAARAQAARDDLTRSDSWARFGQEQSQKGMVAPSLAVAETPLLPRVQATGNAAALLNGDNKDARLLGQALQRMGVQTPAEVTPPTRQAIVATDGGYDPSRDVEMQTRLAAADHVTPMDIKKFNEDHRHNVATEAAASVGSFTPVQTEDGIVQFNNKTGIASPMTVGGAQVQAPSRTADSGFLGSLQQASKNLEDHEGDLTFKAGLLGGSHSLPANYANTAAGQVIQQAGNQWLDAAFAANHIGRPTDAMRKSWWTAYLPVAGDKPETVTAKRAARAQFMVAIPGGASHAAPASTNPLSDLAKKYNLTLPDGH